MAKILLVEDDETIVRTLKDFLHTEGFVVENTDGQKKALSLLEGAEYDLVLLDVSLNEGNGFSLCSAIKKVRQLPVIFLTASGDEFSVVTGLDLGADDYIAKPFRVRELMARMKAILRRTGEYQEQEALTEIGRFTLNLKTGKLYDKETEVVLTAMEYKLLLVFLNHRGQILTRQQILGCLWDEVGDFVNDNTLSVYIKRLRAKMEDENNLIQTVRGIGYRMEA